MTFDVEEALEQETASIMAELKTPSGEYDPELIRVCVSYLLRRAQMLKVVVNSSNTTALDHLRNSANVPEEIAIFQGRLFSNMRTSLADYGASKDEIDLVMFGDEYKSSDPDDSPVLYINSLIKLVEAYEKTTKAAVAVAADMVRYGKDTETTDIDDLLAQMGDVPDKDQLN